MKKVGILGGGQLARMLVLEGHRMGLEMHVLCANAKDPAAQVTRHVHLGSLDSLHSINAFLDVVDAVTFESEFVDVSLLEKRPHTDVHIFPNLRSIALIQDRLSQKQLLDQYKIPTAKWMEIQQAEDLYEAAKRFPKGFVVKKRRFGYDGHGTILIRKFENHHLSLLEASKFGYIAEEFIPFRRELAIIFVRTGGGLTCDLPLVETHQQDSRCLWVKGPIKHRNIGKLQKLGHKMMRELDYQGVLTFELFETTKGLLVNELAPRVHNSGHYSQDALPLCQFEMHLRAGLGWDLPNLKILNPGFAMYNLLGEGHPNLKLSAKSLGKLHWYGKAENRTGRKLGHLNTLGRTSEEALKVAIKWRKDFVL